MPTQYFLTRDPTLLAQYFKLRNRVFRLRYPHLAYDFGYEDFMDRRSHIVVGYDGRVVAGGRITISYPEQPQPLPMEEADFRLALSVPYFGLDREPHAEFSRVAVDRAYAHGRRCSLGLIKELVHTTAQRGVDMVFSICPESQVRWNETNSRKCGVTFEALYDIAVPTPFYIPMTLCVYKGLLRADSRLSAQSA